MTDRIDYLTAALRYCDYRWERAMAHPAYRDEPSDEKPFTDAELLRYWWADSWRNLYHEYESELYRQPEIRHGLLEGASYREPLPIYEGA